MSTPHDAVRETGEELKGGSRHDLRLGLSPDAPADDDVKDERGAFGYVHSYETSSRYDGPGLRVVIFLSGCLLRCTYCHNPDTGHLKDGTHVSAEHIIKRLSSFSPSLKALDGGLTISGDEMRGHRDSGRRIRKGPHAMGQPTPVETSGFL